MPALCIAPREGARPSDDWYPWLGRALDHRAPGRFGPVLAPAMPDPAAPRIGAWVGALQDALRELAVADTVLVGHSLGSRAVLHLLERLRPGAQARGTLLVAGWWWMDEPPPAVLPWMEAELDLARVRAAAGRLVVLLSDDDPYTADWDASRRAWEQLGAEVLLTKGAGHFTGASEPAVVEALATRF